MCTVHRTGFPKIIKDNDDVYLAHLQGVVESVDELATMEISKTPYAWHFRIAPSIPCYIDSLLKEILKMNNMFGIRLDLSKSIKSSATITFEIADKN